MNVGRAKAARPRTAGSATVGAWVRVSARAKSPAVGSCSSSARIMRRLKVSDAMGSYLLRESTCAGEPVGYRLAGVGTKGSGSGKPGAEHLLVELADRGARYFVDDLQTVGKLPFGEPG